MKTLTQFNDYLKTLEYGASYNDYDKDEEGLRKAKEDRKRRALEMYISDNTPMRYIEADPDEADMRLNVDSFIVFGDFGTGKTYAAYQAANRLISDGTIRHYIVTRAFAIMADIKASFGTGDYDARVKKYLSADLLIVDEYGKNTGSEFEDAQLFEILNTRYEHCRRTGIIINAKSKADLINLIRPDVLDRFRGNIIEMNGKSRR